MSLLDVEFLFGVYCIKCNGINDNILFDECNNCLVSNLVDSTINTNGSINEINHDNTITTTRRKKRNSNKQNKKYQEYWKERRIEKLHPSNSVKNCSRCYTENDSDRKLCSKCRTYFQNRKNKKINESLGSFISICKHCLKENDSPSYKCCTKCREYNRSYYYKK